MTGAGMRMHPAAAVLLFAAAAGCGDSPTQPSADVYALVSVNAHALPAPLPPMLPGWPSLVEMTHGSLELRADGTLRLTTQARCITPPPAGTTCEQNTSPDTVAGTYSRAEGWVSLGTGQQYPTTFSGSRVTIDMSTPPSLGTPRVLVLVFER